MFIERGDVLFCKKDREHVKIKIKERLYFKVECVKDFSSGGGECNVLGNVS